MSQFKNKIIEVVRKIPRGKVASYGQVALIAGFPRGAQQVGWILHISGSENGTPWWRVINNAGRISTKCTEHTPALQKKLLEEEGVKVKENLDINIEEYRWRPTQNELNKLRVDEEYIYKVLDKYDL